MFNRVLVPMSGSPRAERILHYVADLARWCESELTLLHVIHTERPRSAAEGDVAYPDILADRAQSLVQEYFGELVSQLDGLGIQARGTTATGDLIDTVVSRARSGGFDLLAFIAEGRRPMSRRFSESAAERIWVRSPIPMLIVNARLDERRGGAPEKVRRLLVPLDGGRVSELALPYARRLARTAGLGITLLRIIPDVPDYHISSELGIGAPRLLEDAERAARDYLERHATALAEEEFDVSSLVMEGRVARVLARAQEEHPDHLLLMASALRHGWQRTVAGCTVDEIVRTSPNRVLVVPAGDRSRHLLEGLRPPPNGRSLDQSRRSGGRIV